MTEHPHPHAGPDAEQAARPPVTTLAALLQEHRDRTGDSYRDIARKTGISKAHVGLLVNGHGEHLPRRETLLALADGLGIPARAVVAAASISAGLTGDSADEPDSGETAMLVAWRALSTRDQATVRTLINALARENRS